MLLDDDPVRAFMLYPPVAVSHAEEGPLSGLTLAVKDLFDVAGYRTGCGCPMKLAASDVCTTHAPVVERLLSAGARFVGKTHTDELAWSMFGMNAHFGTPINPAAPDRIPGGSSSGSAASVAAGLADIALGTDTGGSVRAPASFCGIWGLRPTHGRISLEGCMELCVSFDTCGFFARDAETLLRVAEVLMAEDQAPLAQQIRFLRPLDIIARLGTEQQAVYERAFAGVAARSVSIYPDTGADTLYQAYRVLQGRDAQRSVVPFIAASGMPLATGIDGRYEHARSLTQADQAPAEAVRTAFREKIEGLLAGDGVLLAPVVPDVPFKLDLPTEAQDAYRHEAMRLLCVAGLAGLPQVVMPAGRVDGAPFGVSLIGPRGSDLSLIALARRLTEPRG
jgi:amidase